MTEARPEEPDVRLDDDGDVTVIEVKGLLSQFGDRVIHEDLDLVVEKGEVLGVVGGSGTGKTVLLNTIVGLKDPEGGTVKLFGVDRAEMNRDEKAEIEQRTGLLFQQGALFSSLTVLENVASPLVEHTDLSREVIRDLAEMKIAMVGLGPESHHLKPAWRALWRWTRSCCSWTNRPPASTRSARRPSTS